jgi:TRAP-type mannitol/chloroaromatic compound transport system permease large subunit
LDIDRLFLLANNWFGTMSNFTLLAIPFCIFTRTVLEKSGLAEELLGKRSLWCWVRCGACTGGGAGGSLLAATTGVVAATVVIMGMISLPVMLRYGYDKRLAGSSHRNIGTIDSAEFGLTCIK